MKILRNGLKQGVLLFDEKEQELFLATIKGLASALKHSSFHEAASNLEADINRVKQQKLLGFSQYFHICQKCFCEIDVRKDAFVHHYGGTTPDDEDDKSKDYWIHQQCKELKQNRPE